MVEESQSQTAFKQLYKQKNSFCVSIRERRENFLHEQKEKRHRQIDQNRELFESFIKQADAGTTEMECENSRPTEKKFPFDLMITPWLTDIPEDLGDNWVVKCAPEGFRVILVSKNQSTVCYKKSRKLFRLESNFPGGIKHATAKRGTTILDCIYNKQTKTMFVLDCLCWNYMSLINSEAEFRFYWLKSKFTENVEYSFCEPFKFVLMDCIPAQRPLIQDAMFGCLEIDGNNFFYDGVVFYHKESHYYFCDTPLVGWLASYMLTELLQIDVGPEHLVRKPDDYIDVHDYIRNLKFKKRKKIKRVEKNMDTE